VVNAVAGARMGHPIWGALASAAVTFLALAVATAMLRIPVPVLTVADGLSPWLYSGGVIGALMLFVALVAAP
jgi:transporter family-2 protein